ncbi:MAG: 4Fe-4S double cluster binding domain-containing protein [Candidatus Heimdallarchaeota archaeon]
MNLAKNGIKQAIMAKLEAQGYQGRVVATQHVEDLRLDIDEHYQQNSFDQEFYQERLARYKCPPSEILPDAKSVIVVAVPQPQFRVTFTWQQKKISLIVPPTYLYEQETDKKVEDILAALLTPKGYRVVQAVLPLKLLAGYSGLAKYGKNNICYVSGMGSFCRFVAFYSNMACGEDNWQKPHVLDRCANCSACFRKCPTGAIASERFLLRAERCITFLNEKPKHVSFPKWVEPSWHNALVGCLHCQRACPENKNFLQWIDQSADFSEEETNLFLNGTALNQLPAQTREKLRKHDLMDYMAFFPRNLGVFLKG